MSEDQYLLRDERGHHLTSIFHEVPKKENNFIMIHSDKYWEDLNRELLKLFNLNFTITEFHPDDMKGDEEK